MRFTINMTCDNAAFDPYPGEEVARILRDIADRVELGWTDDTWQTIRDINGNDVGRWKLGEP
jgi:hypothetical protein